MAREASSFDTSYAMASSYATYFAKATKAKKASSYAKASADKTADKTTGKPVCPIASFRSLAHKAIPPAGREDL